MRVFVTGATGFVGSAVVKELMDAGHQVLGLARSDAGAKSLAETGAKVHRGELDDLESLKTGAANVDAVIHTAFVHDFTKFQENCDKDRKAIEALGEVLAGSDRPLIVTGGLALLAHGRAANEDDPPVPVSENYPRASEQTAAMLEQRGVRAMVVRLPQVHDTTKQGLVTYSVQLAREKGISAYIGEGQNGWSAVHRLDAARVYRLALEKGNTGSRFHAVAEERVTFKEIAEVIGKGMNVPVVSLTAEEAKAHFGWMAMFTGLDLVASSTKTQEELGWEPTGPGLIVDLENMRY